MCIVIDSNALPPVFNEKCDNHYDFAPVLAWIIKGKGHLVFGGTRYKKELNRMGRYRKIIIELKKKRKACEICTMLVDKKENELIKITCGENFNDHHIIAILCVSGCILVCSLDSSSDKYIKDSRFYLNKRRKPKIYRSEKNKSLLCDKNVLNLKNTV